MSILVKTKNKYGSDIASYLEGIVVHSKSVYDCWTFEFKTRAVREKHFYKNFEGLKSNYKPEQPICLN